MYCARFGQLLRENAQKFLGTTDCPDITDKSKPTKQKKTKETKMMFSPSRCPSLCSLPSVKTRSARRALPIRVIRGHSYFGAREATIFSKHGSPRRESQNGISFSSP